jgi:hypothetical protein
MGERKVLNKYIPPDFDPAKIPRGKAPKGGQIKVRMMLPMTICCNTCGEFITKGTKFNARKEDVKGEDYLGMRIFRFYFRCTRCAAELAMKTDPKNGDYVVEAGASRNYEMWRDTTEEDEAKAKDDDERDNEMRRLENRTEESKREMDIMAALDEMRSLNARHAGVSNADALRAMTADKKSDAVRADERDAEEARMIFRRQRAQTVNRIESESDDDGDKLAKKPRIDAPAVNVVVKRPNASARTIVKPRTIEKVKQHETGLDLGYGSSSSE